MRSPRGFLAMLTMLAALGPGLATAGPANYYEVPADRPASAVLPAGMVSGPHYRVQSPVVSDGYMYHRGLSDSRLPARRDVSRSRRSQPMEGV